MTRHQSAQVELIEYLGDVRRPLPATDTVGGHLNNDGDSRADTAARASWGVAAAAARVARRVRREECACEVSKKAFSLLVLFPIRIPPRVVDAEAASQRHPGGYGMASRGYSCCL